MRGSARSIALFPHWSLARQFLVAHFLLVLIGVLITGAWIGKQIEDSVLVRTAGVTALYVDSLISPRLQTLATAAWLTPADMTELDKLLVGTALGQDVVVFKIWSPDGHVLYSLNRELIGRHFPVTGGLVPALHGQVTSEMSDLSEPENELERQHWSRLVEVYAPVRREIDGQLIAVNEFYLQPDALEAAIVGARLEAWALVGTLGVALYLLTAGIVRRGTNTIDLQRSRLERQVRELANMHERLQHAASRTIALNEQSLRRISSDLHDGPGQVLALALLRLDALRVACHDHADLTIVHDAVYDALKDVRAISAGLRLPELEPLALATVLERAIGDHERRSRANVDRCLDGLPDPAPLAVKIALVRTVQESLSNATRHAGGLGLAVSAWAAGGRLWLEVADDGPGFDPASVAPGEHLGLAGMRERTELLGGSFNIRSAFGRGTTVTASWPLSEHIGV